MEKFDASLLDHVEFINGHSLEVLPAVLAEMKEVYFASLDGGAHPDICLKEFELVTAVLAKDCALVVDDMVDLKPTKAYPGIRPIGKCTLIYPALIMADYLRLRKEKKHMAPDFKPDNESDIICSLDEGIFNAILDGDVDFVPIGNPAGHRLLVFGSRLIVEEVSGAKPEAPGQAKPAQKKGGFLGKFFKS